MKYETKQWKFEAFEYDPFGQKPDWWLKMVREGNALECAPFKNNDKYYATFKDKRSSHKAFVGDFIIRDEFGRFDVYSAKNFAARAKRV